MAIQLKQYASEITSLSIEVNRTMPPYEGRTKKNDSQYLFNSYNRHVGDVGEAGRVDQIYKCRPVFDKKICTSTPRNFGFCLLTRCMPWVRLSGGGVVHSNTMYPQRMGCVRSCREGVRVGRDYYTDGRHVPTVVSQRLDA